MASIKLKFQTSTSPEISGSIVYKVSHPKVTRNIRAELVLFPCEWSVQGMKPPSPWIQKRIELRQIADETHANDAKPSKSQPKPSSPTTRRAFKSSRRMASLFPFMEDIIEKLRESKQTSTASNYAYALRSFKKFRSGKDIPLSKIDSIVINDYQAWLKNAKLMRNSISLYMRIIRAVYNRAVCVGLTSDREPFRKAFTGLEKTRKRAISVSEIQRIRNLNLSNCKSLIFARDIFLFLFFCRGMSFIDAAFLKKDNLINGAIVYRRRKTGQRLQIKVATPINELITKYSVPDSPFLLPIISTPGEDEWKQYQSSLRLTNRHLKAIGEMARLPIRLSTYVSRHSWATIAKKKNVPITVISEALGHESLSTTQIYLDSIGTTEIDRANDTVISGL